MSKPVGSDGKALTERFARLLARRILIPELKVLLALACGDPANMYELKKRANYTYPTVHGATKNLEKLGWVTVVRRGMSKKNNPMRIYGLTVEGLLWLLSHVPKSSYPSFVYHPWFGLKKTPSEKDIEELEKLDKEKDVYLHLFLGFDFDLVAEKNPALLPTVLGKWKTFRNFGVAEELTWHFPNVAFETLKEYYCGFEGIRTRYSSLDKIFAYKLFCRYLENISKPSSRMKEPNLQRYKASVIQKAVVTLTSNPELMDLAEQILKDIKADINWRQDFISTTEARIAEMKSHEHKN